MNFIASIWKLGNISATWHTFSFFFCVPCSPICVWKSLPFQPSLNFRNIHGEATRWGIKRISTTSLGFDSLTLDGDGENFSWCWAWERCTNRVVMSFQTNQTPFLRKRLVRKKKAHWSESLCHFCHFRSHSKSITIISNFHSNWDSSPQKEILWLPAADGVPQFAKDDSKSCVPTDNFITNKY